MKKHLATPTLLLAALLSLSTPAAAVANSMIGAGTFQCGEWTEARAGRGNGKLFVEMAQSWVQGYMSAINLFADAGKDVTLPSVTVTSAYLDKWCAANPLKEVYLGSSALIGELRAQRR